MKVAHITDLHITEKYIDGPDGHARLLADAAKAICQSGAVLCTVGGDLAGYTVPHRSTIRERNLLVDFMVEVSKVMPVVVARGNHDPVGEWLFLNHCRGKHPITYSEDPEIISTVHAEVLVLPWLDQTRFQGTQDYSGAVMTRYQTQIAEFSDLLVDAGKQGKCRVMLVHGAFSKAMFRDGQPAVPTADPMIDLPVIADPKLFDVVLAGHYHLHQTIKAKIPACYGGSLATSQFGEDHPKGWTLYDHATGEITHQPVAQRRRMKVVVNPATSRISECSPEVDGMKGLPVGKLRDFLEEMSLSDCDIRVVYEATGENAVEAAGQINAVEEALSLAGAKVEIKAKIERQIQMREGLAEVASATTLAGKVRAWAAASKVPVTKATVEGSVVRLNDLEARLAATK
jgi:DNA repair exonuclease SbcCD nuclease subunit